LFASRGAGERRRLPKMLYEYRERFVSSHAKPAEPVELSIGSLSTATGVPIDTLRTWERRYGFPVPIGRTEGSHRRYSADTIPVVRLIVQALELGHRPSAVIGRDPEELARLVGPVPSSPPLTRIKDAGAVEHWLSLTRDFDGAGLSREFHFGLSVMPAIDFLERLMGPFLAELGERWRRGELRIAHEHFASERAREFLSGEWRGLTERARADGRPSVVFATPPGERHVLGLHMAAWVVACAGASVVFLGADTPILEIASAAEQYGSAGVVLSVASGYEGPLPKYVALLHRHLPPQVSVVLGGGGSRALGATATHLNRFSDLSNWTESLG
jgi:methylmalonyl-CoA mutase cobalamin-binding subunit